MLPREAADALTRFERKLQVRRVREDPADANYLLDVLLAGCWPAVAGCERFNALNSSEDADTSHSSIRRQSAER